MRQCVNAFTSHSQIPARSWEYKQFLYWYTCWKCNQLKMNRLVFCSGDFVNSKFFPWQFCHYAAFPAFHTQLVEYFPEQMQANVYLVQKRKENKRKEAVLYPSPISLKIKLKHIKTIPLCVFCLHFFITEKKTRKKAVLNPSPINLSVLQLFPGCTSLSDDQMEFIETFTLFLHQYWLKIDLFLFYLLSIYHFLFGCFCWCNPVNRTGHLI